MTNRVKVLKTPQYFENGILMKEDMKVKRKTKWFLPPLHLWEGKKQLKSEYMDNFRIGVFSSSCSLFTPPRREIAVMSEHIYGPTFLDECEMGKEEEDTGGFEEFYGKHFQLPVCRECQTIPEERMEEFLRKTFKFGPLKNKEYDFQFKHHYFLNMVLVEGYQEGETVYPYFLFINTVERPFREYLHEKYGVVGK